MTHDQSNLGFTAALPPVETWLLCRASKTHLKYFAGPINRRSAMAQLQSPQFARRENRDGTFDSICSECFQTIATSRRVALLENAERAHACDPLELERD